MRVILLKFLPYSFVPALSNSLKEYENEVCIAYKISTSARVYVLTTSPAVADYLYETNPNCQEITNVDSFLKNDLVGFLLTNTDFLKTHFSDVSGKLKK